MQQENNFQQKVIQVVQNYLKGKAFSDRKITDTPTDALSVVNRKYVTLNGASTSRPTSSVVGQFYLDTTLNKPLWWNGTGFIDATGAYH
jgi:hypothetical protein